MDGNPPVPRGDMKQRAVLVVGGEIQDIAQEVHILPVWTPQNIPRGWLKDVYENWNVAKQWNAAQKYLNTTKTAKTIQNWPAPRESQPSLSMVLAPATPSWHILRRSQPGKMRWPCWWTCPPPVSGEPHCEALLRPARVGVDKQKISHTYTPIWSICIQSYY